jgi:preprotein translocase subunit SecD
VKHAVALILLCWAPAVAAQEAQPVQVYARDRGLWLGPLPLCSESVASVTFVQDEAGFPQLSISLRPQWRLALERLTTRFVARQIPVRLNGRTVTAPVITEPITDGAVAISGGEAGLLVRMRAATRLPCRRRR